MLAIKVTVNGDTKNALFVCGLTDGERGLEVKIEKYAALFGFEEAINTIKWLEARNKQFHVEFECVAASPEAIFNATKRDLFQIINNALEEHTFEVAKRLSGLTMSEDGVISIRLCGTTEVRTVKLDIFTTVVP